MVWLSGEQRCLELMTGILFVCGGLEGVRRVVRYRDEDQRAIVPAVNKSLMILARPALVLLD